MKFKIIIAILLLFATAGVNAQEVYTLDECIAKALEHNQTIKIKEANRSASEADVKLSKRAALPNFDLEGAYTYQSHPMEMVIQGYELPTTSGTASGVYSPGGVTPLSYNHTYNAGVTASVPLYLGGTLTHSRAIAEAAQKIAESEVALSESEVIYSIESQYWTLVALTEQSVVLSKSIEFLEVVVADMTNLCEAGIITKNEVLKSEVELNNARLAKITVDNNITLCKMALNQSIGVGVGNLFNLDNQTIEIAISEQSVDAHHYDVQNREELKMLWSTIEIGERELKLTKATYHPQIAGFASYGAQNPNYQMENIVGAYFVGGVTLSIPIFHWGEKGLKKQKAQMKINAAKLQAEQTEELLSLEIQQAIFRLKEALVKLEFTEGALVQSDENLRLESDRLKEQLLTTTDLLNAQMQWQKSEADFIAAKVGVKICEAFYRKAIGENLE